VEAALLELVPLVEVALRGLPDEPAWPEPVPFTSPALPRFPTDVFAPWLHDHVQAVSRAMQVPAELPSMLALSILSTACAKRVVVQVREGWREPVNVYTITVLPSGERKTPTFAVMVGPLEEWERASAERAQGRIAEEQARRDVLEKTLARAKDAAARAAGAERREALAETLRLARELDAQRVPQAPRLLVGNVTSEKLAQMLGAHGGRMALLSDEGDALDIMAGRYTSGSPNIEVYLKGHSGSSLVVDLIGRVPDHVSRPALTLGLAVQPTVLESLKAQPGFHGRGLLARFLCSLPSSLLGMRDTAPPPVPTEVARAFREHINALLELPAHADEQGKPAEYVLHLDRDARECFAAFERWLEPRLAPQGDLGHMRDWGGKLAGTVGRLSGLLHMATRAGDPEPWRAPIGRPTVERAIILGQYLTAHAQAAYATMGSDPATDGARYLLHRIREREWTTFSRQEVWQATKGTFNTVAPLTAALNLLVDHGYLREHSPVGGARRPGPHGCTYLVHPGFLQSLDSLEQPDGPPDCRDCRTVSRAL
jgi:hypothetical protein